MKSTRSRGTVLLLVIALAIPYARAQTWQELLARADSLQQAANYDSALVLAHQALAITERENEGDDSSVALVLQSIGACFYYQGDYADAEQNWRRAEGIWRGVLGRESPQVAACLNNLGAVAASQGRLTEAEPLIRQALQIREKVLQPDDPDIARSLNGLALVCRDQGRYEEAESLGTRSLQISEKALGEHPYVATSLNNLALLYDDMGRYAEAEPLLRRGLEIFLKTLGPNHPDVAWNLNNLGVICERLTRYDEAEQFHKRALAIREEVFGPDHPDVAASLNNLAAIYGQEGRYQDEEPILRRALEINEKVFGPDHPLVAMSVLNLGVLLWREAQYAEAEPMLVRALGLYEKSYGPDHPDVALCLSDLAGMYDDQERYAEAVPLLLRSLQIREKAMGHDSPATAECLLNLAIAVGNQGRPVEAESYFNDALAVFSRTLDSRNPSIAVALHNYAGFRTARGELVEAARLESRAWTIRCQNFRDGCTVLAERNVLEYSEILRAESSCYLSALLRSEDGSAVNSQEIAHVVFTAKAVVSDEIMARSRLHVPGEDGTETSLWDSLQSVRSTLSQLYIQGAGEEDVQAYHHRLDEVTQAKERLEAELARISASFAREQALWDMHATDVASSLPSGSALVEFMRYNHNEVHEYNSQDRYLAVLLKGDGTLSVFPLGLASAIDTAVYWYRQQFRNPQSLDQTAISTAAENLYSLVWRPFAALVTGVTTVFIAPDGELNLVSFAGLTDDNGQYLIEKFPIHYLSTGRDLIRLQEESASGNGLLAMGDPDFDLSYGMSTASAVGLALLTTLNLRSSCNALNKLNVPPLPGTRKEVESVAGQWTRGGASVVTYIGADATEEHFKQSAPGKRVIHLATHGFYISDECQKKLDTRGASGTGASGYVGENPLLLSGFLLAGANHHGEGANEAQREDGIVTAEEVAGLNLNGTDLVILSACETGLGEVKSGEGVYGLRRAFQMAGARTVISALWPIDDKMTAEFMGQLFSAQNETLPQTMQRIALARLADLHRQGKSDHPFYWAAFVATGDWKMH